MDNNTSSEHGLKRPALADVLRSLAESSSWHGVPKIASSRQLAVKILWCLVMVATMVTFGIQLYSLFKTFYLYPIQTTVSLDSSSLPIPAITICNMNPIRKSKLSLSPTLQEVLYPSKRKPGSARTKRSVTDTPDVSPSTDKLPLPDNLQKSTNMPIPDNLPKSTNMPIPDNLPKSTNMPIPDNLPMSENISSSDNVSMFDSLYNTITPFLHFPGFENVTLFNESDGNISALYEWWDYYYAYDDLWSHNDTLQEYEQHELFMQQMLSPRDQWQAGLDKFKFSFRELPVQTRLEMGHQLHHMVYRVTFNKLEFTRAMELWSGLTTAEYGNCHTLQAPFFVSHRSGPDHGITLTLNLEVDETISNFASGYGIRVVFHEPGTLAMPREEGLTITPGYETSIGLRVVNITRLGQPYGDCTDGQEFQEKFGLKYTRQACVEFCRVRVLLKKCGCIPFSTPEAMYLHLPESVRICNPGNSTDFFCVGWEEYQLQFSEECVCVSPCRELVYKKTMSGRRWPNKDYLEKVLLRDLCANYIMSSMDAVCEQMRNGDVDFIRYQHDFLRLLVYYEDLNFESINQEPFYETVRFISDIGGTMGLFMGCSVLSFMEILQLLLELGIYFTRRQEVVNKDEAQQNDEMVKMKHV